MAGTIISRRRFLKRAFSAGAALSAWPYSSVRAMTSPFPGPFLPTWDSLSEYQVPDWYRDAKFGVFMHWGIYSVPAHANEWYPHYMYVKGNSVYEWHQQHWGPQSMFGYKDFIPMFRAENWKPDELVQLYKNAGAKYIVPVGEHHDGFPMYDSHLTDWSAAKMGPHRDTIAVWAREVRNQGLKLGISSHRAHHWFYYTYDKNFDTDNPLYAGLYGPIHHPVLSGSGKPGTTRQAASKEFLQDWFARSIEIVDLYHPDLIYFDGANRFPEFEPYRKQFAAYYYDVADELGSEVVMTYKRGAYPEHTAVLDIERGLAGEIREFPWQTDTSVSWKSWGYIDNDSFKSPSEIIPEFVDIVSKNGNLLLNVGPKHDGTIPEQAEEIFRGIGHWMDINGEAIYATRPWKIYGEGPTNMASGGFSERKLEKVHFTPQDIRFTSKGKTIYAILLAWPEGEVRIKAIGKSSKLAPARISNVTLLGSDAKLKWRQDPEALTVQMPDEKPGDFAYSFKINT